MRIIAIILIAAGMIWGAVLNWSHPDMTDRRIIMEFPMQVIGSVFLMILGMLWLYRSEMKR
jgi:uncharacterized membrane protein